MPIFLALVALDLMLGLGLALYALWSFLRTVLWLVWLPITLVRWIKS